MILVTLILITLATLTSWDLLRRLLPVHAPVFLGRAVAVGIALILVTFASTHVLLALASVGGLIVLGTWISVEPTRPWGPYVRPLVAWLRLRLSHKPARPGTPGQPKTKIGHRLPPGL